MTFSFLAARAHAAPLTFTSATPLILTSPSTTLTIAPGSAADSFTVNATSVAVGLSATTGGDFTLLSPAYHLAVATSSTGGTVTYTCASAGTSTLVLAQASGATTYTITLTSASCPATSSSSGGTVVGVGGTYPPATFLVNGGASSTASPEVILSFAAPPSVSSFSITTSRGGEEKSATTTYASTLSLNLCTGFSSCTGGTYLVSVAFLDANGALLGSSSQVIAYAGTGVPLLAIASSSVASEGAATIATSTASVAQLEALLAEIRAELQTLLKEAAARGIAVKGTTPSPAFTSDTFTRNLSLWDRGADVNALQRYLVTKGKGPAARALARHSLTDTFGPLTFAALKEFQKAAGIVPDNGYFGPLTRAYIRSHGD